MGMLYEYTRDERAIITGGDQMSEPDKSIRWYLAGPMTGIKSFNYPMFDAIAAKLRADGYRISNPTELESPEARRIIEASPDGSPETAPPCSSWAKSLGRDIPRLIEDCGGIILLPEWWKSKGARLEATAGLLCNKKFAAWARYYGVAVEISAFSIAHRLCGWLSEYILFD